MADLEEEVNVGDHQEFKIIEPNKTGFYLWRVESFGLVPVPEDQIGTFYKGDSYVLYSITDSHSEPGVREEPRDIIGHGDAHIHFWLGSNSSQDKQGVAAMKTVELDDYLQGNPSQHRETEGYESKRFLAYFKDGMRIKEGGVAGGFRKMDNTFINALYRVKGKRTTLVTELPEISWGAMNNGDVYVLETEKLIFVWTGKYSNNMEKIQGAKFATTVKSMNGKGSVVVVEDGEERKLPRDQRKVFDEFLPLAEKNVIPVSQATADDAVIRRLTTELRLYECSEDEGEIYIGEVKTGPLLQADLQSDHSYIIDMGRIGVWIWIGKRATKRERVEALKYGQSFIEDKGYPENTLVSRIVDGGEPPEFKTLFKDWKDKYETVGFGTPATINRIAKVDQVKFDAATLHQKTEIAAETQLVDDGTGEITVWRVQDGDKVEVDDENHGEFFMGECYIILYSYNVNNRNNFIIYFWIGLDASQESAGHAALLTVDLDDELNGRAVQVRVTQGKEPPHFMLMFKASMVIYEGKYLSSFEDSAGTNHGRKEKFLLHVRGTTEFNTCATEVDLRAASLNSNDCFILSDPDQTFVWIGLGASADEKDMAISVAQSLSDPLMQYEGEETEEFWTMIGGHEPYASNEHLQVETAHHPARLFHTTMATGTFTADEIMHFNQQDLDENDVMLLDAWDTIFLWVGRYSTQIERKNAEALAWEYLRTDLAGRDKGTPIMKVKQGHEPPNFTGFFGVWYTDLWDNMETYGDILDQLEQESPGVTIVIASSGQSKYSLNTLLKPLDNLPRKVDPTAKEEFLKDEDFVNAFGMEREEFNNLAKWKQEDLKRNAGLY